MPLYGLENLQKYVLHIKLKVILAEIGQALGVGDVRTFKYEFVYTIFCTPLASLPQLASNALWC